MIDKLEDISGAASLIAQLTSPNLLVEEMALLQSELWYAHERTGNIILQQEETCIYRLYDLVIEAWMLYYVL